MIITILGSCRQHSLKNKYSITSIQEELSYPHYTKEMIEVIKYCKHNHISQDNTINIFRTPILTKKPLDYNKLFNEFNSTDLFILEIASKIKYRNGNFYVHHIATENKYNVVNKNDIVIEYQSKEEVEEDILQIKNELSKPIIIVSHLVTKNTGERYNLACWLEEICFKHKIPFINPVKELTKRNIDVSKIFINEPVLAHYNDEGHKQILSIYSEFIDNMFAQT